MRYAVPVTGERLASHFGHCSHFAMFDVDDSTRVILRKELVPSPGHEPGLLPAWLAEEGVSVVIAGGMGSRAQGIFRESRIEVVVGVRDDDPETVVLNYLSGALSAGDNLCDH